MFKQQVAKKILLQSWSDIENPLSNICRRLRLKRAFLTWAHVKKPIFFQNSVLIVAQAYFFLSHRYCDFNLLNYFLYILKKLLRSRNILPVICVQLIPFNSITKPFLHIKRIQSCFRPQPFQIQCLKFTMKLLCRMI